MSISKYNSEGYPDPTAYEALAAIEKEARRLRLKPYLSLNKRKKHKLPIRHFSKACEGGVNNA